MSSPAVSMRFQYSPWQAVLCNEQIRRTRRRRASRQRKRPVKCDYRERQSYGREIEGAEDGFTITGAASIPGNSLWRTYSDHRLAMTGLIASYVCEEPLTVEETNFYQGLISRIRATTQAANHNLVASLKCSLAVGTRRTFQSADINHGKIICLVQIPAFDIPNYAGRAQSIVESRVGESFQTGKIEGGYLVDCLLCHG